MTGGRSTPGWPEKQGIVGPGLRRRPRVWLGWADILPVWRRGSGQAWIKPTMIGFLAMFLIERGGGT